MQLKAIGPLARDDSMPRATADAEPGRCWICLSTQSEGFELTKACGCPREVHLTCLARWQLQQAGRREERQCRFCGDLLPEWTALTKGLQPVEPIFKIAHKGELYSVHVKGGEHGRQQYEHDIREILDLSGDEEVRPIFSCQMPGSGEDVCLEGWGAYEAAIVCSSVAAGQQYAAAPCTAAPAQQPALGGRVGTSSSALLNSAVQQDGGDARGGVARLL